MSHTLIVDPSLPHPPILTQCDAPEAHAVATAAVATYISDTVTVDQDLLVELTTAGAVAAATTAAASCHNITAIITLWRSFKAPSMRINLTKAVHAAIGKCILLLLQQAMRDESPYMV